MSYKLHPYVFHVTKAWVDEFLTWDPEVYDGVDFVSLRKDDIWIPDVTVYER